MKVKLFSGIMLIALCIVGCTPTELGDRGNSISVNPNVYYSHKSYAEFKVEVKSTSAWSATADHDWVEIVPSSGQGDAFVKISVDLDTRKQDTINVLFSNGSGSATLKIGINMPYVLEKIRLNYESLLMSTGSTTQLRVIYEPEKAIDSAPEVTWKSSNKSVASVDNEGLVTSLKQGKTTITAECGALRATCDVEVIKLPETIADNGALNGKFSVSPTSQVQFSQGNLQYQASTKTWRFAEHQYDYVGEANENISSTYSGWIDLFCWGTGDNPTLTSWQYSDYASFTDWGINKISNGGNTANQWRTLTKDEWDYLYSGASLRSQATVNNVPGYIFLPDNWSLPSGMSFTANANNWTTNNYSAADWVKMEQNGAVFLPAAGYRIGKGGFDVGSYGNYWSSTPYRNSTIDAYYLGFNSSNVNPQYANYRDIGQSVRLVR